MKPNNFKFLLLSFVTTALILTGCGGSSDYMGATNYYAEDNYAYKGISEASEPYYDNFDNNMLEFDNNNFQLSSNRKLIYTYNVRVQTKDFANYVSNVESITNNVGGYIESNDYYNYGDSKNATFVIRIPQNNVQDAMSKIEEDVNVVSHSATMDDRTSSYVDIDARMKSYEDELETLENLSKRAETVSELLEIEQTIADVRGQRDSLKAQLNTIDELVSYSTLNLEVSEVVIYDYSKPTFMDKLASGFEDVGDDITDMLSNYITSAPIFIIGLILFAIPVTLVFGIGMLIAKLLKKLSSNTKGNKNENIATKPDINTTTNNS